MPIEFDSDTGLLKFEPSTDDTAGLYHYIVFLYYGGSSDPDLKT